MVQHWFQPVPAESTRVQSKAMGKIKFLNFVQMELDKNRLKDSHCKLDSGMKGCVGEFFCCCSGLGFSPFHSALACNKANVKRRMLGKRHFLVPSKQVKKLRELEVLKNSLLTQKSQKKLCRRGQVAVSHLLHKYFLCQPCSSLVCWLSSML